MHEEKNERVQVFSVQIREALDRLTVQFPGRIIPYKEDKTLCDQLFCGMKSELKNEGKGVTKVQTKGIIVGETSLMSKLQQQVTQLTTLVKSGQIGPNKTNASKEFPRRNDNQNNNGSQKDQNNGDASMKSKGPETGPNGPFGPGQRPIQCYKCKG